VEQKAMQHPWLETEGEPVSLTLATIEGLLGDKLTAFAPTTTGILYTKNRPMEIIKQLFDIGCLFDQAGKLEETSAAFHSIAVQELKYRGMKITPAEVLEDAFQAAVTVCDRNLADPNFQHLAKGIHNIKPHIFYRFVIEDAVVCAAKVMLLATLLRQNHSAAAPKYGAAKDILEWLIPTTDYNRFNKLRKTNPEAFFYVFKTCERLNELTP